MRRRKHCVQSLERRATVAAQLNTAPPRGPSVLAGRGTDLRGSEPDLSLARTLLPEHRGHLVHSGHRLANRKIPLPFPKASTRPEVPAVTRVSLRTHTPRARQSHASRSPGARAHAGPYARRHRLTGSRVCCGHIANQKGKSAACGREGTQAPLGRCPGRGLGRSSPGGARRAGAGPRRRCPFGPALGPAARSARFPCGASRAVSATAPADPAATVSEQKMAVPPTYADLGKSARDVFTKGYGFGLIKLDLKTKSENGLEFTSSGSANTETTKVTGSLETKYRWTEYGLTFTEKWNTDNTLGTEITVEDQLARGLKLTFDSSFSPNTGKKNAKIKTGYKREHINLGCDVDFDIAGPSIRGALVLGYEGWLAGYQMNFETAKSRVTQSNFAVGYKTDEFQLHTNVNDGTEFGGSIYQKVNKKLETAVNLAWTAGNSNTRFGIAAKYQIDPDACFSAKVNNSSLIGLGYTQTLKPGIKLTLSALLDGKNVNAGGHKLGLGLEFQA
ncbi:Voltage-dependent anion-selective channel protein 1 [Sciurus carolinensis]|uniref:Non-selective voltage-gated ion channel VDAC1 n=1 Tax=Sciurus carolinensis TaxID=30640 RepID=A0AA41MDA3_SCICA|nr:Voltage-dependent anion-selective channel protein 1 [Sciurus carolinensis]